MARVDIPTGTRVLCEKPIFLTANYAQTAVAERQITNILRRLTPFKRQQFLSLYNHFPGRFPRCGIVKTNALPCVSDSSSGGIFATACLINHSCLPNTTFNWDDNATWARIHAICDIKAGDEITVDYNSGDPSEVRRIRLKTLFGFTCTCQICSSSTAQVLASNTRRILIQRLRSSIKEFYRLINEPEDCLADCHRLLQIQDAEYRGQAGGMNFTVYQNAFKISIYHGDRARARVFAQRVYRLRVCYQGHDHPDTQRAKLLMERPSTVSDFRPRTRRWEIVRAMIPGGLDAVAFERWLWRQEA